jgi:hypothetical protein
MLLLPPPLLLLLPLELLRAQGWDPREPDMQRVVAIHNTVNERAWQHVMAWEALHACDCAEPRLKRFQGKPNEFSPKARLLNMLVRATGPGHLDVDHGYACAFRVCTFSSALLLMS